MSTLSRRAATRLALPSHADQLCSPSDFSMTVADCTHLSYLWVRWNGIGQAGSMLAVLPLVTQIADLCFGVLEGALIKAKWSTLAVRKLASCSAYVMSAVGLVIFSFATTARRATVGYCLAHAIAMPAHFGSGFGQCYREVGGESSGSLAALCTHAPI